jgi:hypothetical protein
MLLISFMKRSADGGPNRRRSGPHPKADSPRYINVIRPVRGGVPLALIHTAEITQFILGQPLRPVATFYYTTVGGVGLRTSIC